MLSYVIESELAREQDKYARLVAEKAAHNPQCLVQFDDWDIHAAERSIIHLKKLLDLYKQAGQ